MQPFRKVRKWYKVRNNVRTLEGMVQKFEVYYNGIVMSKFGCTPPNLALYCPHQSADSELVPFAETDYDLREKVREILVGESSIEITL